MAVEMPEGWWRSSPLSSPGTTIQKVCEQLVQAAPELRRAGVLRLAIPGVCEVVLAPSPASGPPIAPAPDSDRPAPLDDPATYGTGDWVPGFLREGEEQ